MTAKSTPLASDGRPVERRAVYVVIIDDRHTDTDVAVFSTAEKAIAFAKAEVFNLASHPEDIEEEEVKEWLYCVRYSGEGDSIWVVERVIDVEEL